MKTMLPKPGKYIIAVSGGIDSVCLLDILSKTKDYQLIVAHLDHGIRSDSHLDLEFVRQLANKYKLDFVSMSAHLGADASEAQARTARYSFLKEQLIKFRALGIITAHHQDDRLETLIINLVRGTGRSGISSIKETTTIKRPLLSVTKAELKSYANKENLSWREDSTNQQETYLRNYIRHNILPKLSDQTKKELISIMDRQAKTNKQIDQIIMTLLKNNTTTKLSRAIINNMPYTISKELMATWLRLNNLVNFDRRTIERLTVAAKTKPVGVKLDVIERVQMRVTKDYLALATIER